jgi:hypothetical protein
LIYGYEYEGYPLEPVIRAFETLASKIVTLSSAAAAKFGGTSGTQAGDSLRLDRSS